MNRNGRLYGQHFRKAALQYAPDYRALRYQLQVQNNSTVAAFAFRYHLKEQNRLERTLRTIIMNTNNIQVENSGSSIFLAGTILFANLDYTGLTEYALKALIGGGIWLMFKLTGDRIAERRKGRKPKNNHQ